MAIDFTSPRKPTRELPLAAMIDVVFILIFFFMLTTSFLQIESMQLMLPSSNAAPSSGTKSSAIILRGDASIQLDKKEIPLAKLGPTLFEMIQKNPNHAFVVLVDDQVQMQRMVSVMDAVNLAGGKRVYIRPLK